MCLFTQIAFIECLLCAWHLQDTENMTMSSLVQTGAQPSGSLHSGGRGDQIIARITSLLSQTQGNASDSSAWEWEGAYSPHLKRRSHFWGSLWDLHLFGDTAITTITRTGLQCQLGGLEIPQDRQELSRRSLCPLALSPKGCSQPGADSTRLISQLPPRK